MTSKTLSEKTLADYQREHRLLAKRLSRIGFLWPGSLSVRYLKCGNPCCGCQKDPAARHGPYCYWTTKKVGKTVSRKLPVEEAQILEHWIANRKELKSIVAAMMAVSESALPLLLEEKANQHDAKLRR